MAALITLDVAKDALRVRTTDQDADILLKVDQASAIILRHLGTQAVAGWTAQPQTEIPPNDVIAATLYVLEDLYERRPIQWDTVERLLVAIRTSALA